jgi:flagellar hook protein FlgE
MNTMLSIGAAGMQSAMSNLEASAGRVARWGNVEAQAAGTDLTHEAVTQIQSRHQFEANAQTVKTADALLGTLIDTFA